jgi:hypothetical protein
MVEVGMVVVLFESVVFRILWSTAMRGGGGGGVEYTLTAGIQRETYERHSYR